MSRPLLTSLPEILEPLRTAPSVSLFLDFDGTLAPIVEDPAKAALDPSMRTILTCLSGRPDVLTAVISGRALSDLRARIGIDRVVYAGNHGLEIDGRGVRFTEPSAAAGQHLVSRTARSLARRLRDIPGALVEDKGLTASIHYRQVAPARHAEVEEIVRDVTRSAVPPLSLRSGKMVWELLPKNGWRKGAAVSWINSRLAGERAVSIYVGDDRTDETAFRRLANQITVCVGPAVGSAARYRVADPAGVREFLLWLSRIR